MKVSNSRNTSYRRDASTSRDASKKRDKNNNRESGMLTSIMDGYNRNATVEMPATTVKPLLKEMSRRVFRKFRLSPIE
jgi:hypothetical protein